MSEFVYLRFVDYPFDRAAPEELGLPRGLRDAAREHFTAALWLARNPSEQRFLEKGVRACETERRAAHGM